MERVNIFETFIEPTFFFTAFPADKTEYTFMIYDFKSAELKTIAKYKDGKAKQYYVWSCRAEEEYKEAGIPKNAHIKIHFPKISFDNALGRYFAGDFDTWKMYKEQFSNKDCNAVLNFTRKSQKEIKINSLRVMSKGI